MKIRLALSSRRSFLAVRHMGVNYRNFIRFVLIPVIIFALLLNLDEITGKKNDFFEGMVNSYIRIAPARTSSPTPAARFLSTPKMQQKRISFPPKQPRGGPPRGGPPRSGPPRGVIPKSKHSIQKSPVTKIQNGGKKHIIKSPAKNDSSIWTKWLKLLNHTEINNEKHLLVIVTTWVSSEEKRLVHENVVRLWAYWPKLVQPLVYLIPTSDSKIDDDRKKHFINDFNVLVKNGWIVRTIPKISCGDVPVLKYMILDAMRLFPKSDFYGFANSDILFDSGLIETLEGTKRLVPTKFPVLVLGQRTNLNVTKGVRFANPDSVLQASKNGSLMKGVAIDYFITNKIFPWHKIPDIVVGRIHYDNWMIYYGVSQDAIVIEATSTTTALHQTTADGNAAGWSHAHRYCNKNIIQRFMTPFRTRWGYTWCAPHKATKNPKTGSIELETRKVSPSCNPRKPPFDFSKTKNVTEKSIQPKTLGKS